MKYILSSLNIYTHNKMLCIHIRTASPDCVPACADTPRFILPFSLTKNVTSRWFLFASGPRVTNNQYITIDWVNFVLMQCYGIKVQDILGNNTPDWLVTHHLATNNGRHEEYDSLQESNALYTVTGTYQRYIHNKCHILKLLYVVDFNI